MTDFNDRQKGEERKFAMDEETAFRVAARNVFLVKVSYWFGR